MSMEAHKHTENAKSQSGLELEEDGSSDSSCMIVSESPSVHKKGFPCLNERTISRDPRKETSNQIAYDKSQASKRYKTTGGRLDSQAHTSALKRAKELQTSLSTKHPSFIKQMHPSHVTRKFKLGVPLEFRTLNLPAHNVQVTLENECGKSYNVSFLGGTEGRFIWKRFSVANNLLEGDVVVFHLLRPRYFKVYIVRANDPAVVGSTDLTSANVHANKGKQKRKCEATDRKGCRLAPHLNTVLESVKRTSLLSSPCVEPRSGHSSSEEFQSSDMEATPLSGCDADFGNITNVDHDNNQTSESCLTKRGRIDYEAQASALERAKELQTNLSSKYPSFIKQMHPSNVIPKSALVLPMEFCRPHLPNHDAEVTLEDENGASYIVNFLPRDVKRFRRGWSLFSAEHKLLEGDVLVFHLLRPCHIKVYIIRANDPTVVGSTDFTSSNVNANKVEKKRKHEAAPHLDTAQESVKRTALLSNPSIEPGSDHSVLMEELQSEDTEASPSPGRDTGFDNFRIVVNEEIIDGELSRSTQFKFYKLCCSRESYLHEHLLESVDRKLAAGIIRSTLKVADAIRACKLSASEEDFAMWDNTLAGFERLGMDVEFMRDRLKQLASRASEFREKEEVKRYKEAKSKRDSTKEEMKRMEQKYMELKQTADKLGDEMKTLKANILKCRDNFQEEANAPW